MSKSNAFETDLLAITLNGTPIPNIADNAATAPLANLWIALHTADPGEAGTQSTSEATYTGYGRTSVARSPGSPAWTVSSPGGVGTAQNAALIAFPQCTGGTNTITHWSIGTAQTGTGKVLYRGALSATLAVSNLITPQFQAGAIQITED